MTSYRYIGYGVTNSNGVAHLDHDPQGNSINGYTGTGAGEVDVVASLDNPVVEGSIVSEIYDVCDAVWYDKGILDDPQTNDNWGDYSSFATLTRTLTHSILKETGSTNVIARIYNNGRTYKFNGNYCLELDKKYPEYHIAKHKGYGTKDHLQALEQYGPKRGLHRFSYKPVKKFLIEKVTLF